MKQLFALLAALAVLSAAPAAHAQTFRELMQDLGIQKRETPNIDFSERAPLVLPPEAQTLPPPEEGAALATVNPNWPNDPDDIAEQEALEREKIPQHLRRKYKENAAKDIYAIRHKEREEGLAETAPRPYDTIFDRDKVLSPSELKEVRDKRAAEAANTPAIVYVEPERKRLTDPPPGYRMPSPAQPFGPGAAEEKKKNNWFSKINPFD